MAKKTSRKAAPAKARRANTKTGKTTKTTKTAKNARRTRAAPRKAPARNAPARKTTGRARAAPRPVKDVNAPNVPALQPMLTVPNVQAAVDLLGKVGFQPVMTMPHPAGGLGHAVLVYKDAMVHVGALDNPGAPDTPRMQAIRRGPLGLGVNLYVMVDNVESVHSILRGSNVTITQAPKDEFWGDRTLVCVDPFGFEWSFAQHVKDVSPEDMAKAAERSLEAAQMA